MNKVSMVNGRSHDAHLDASAGRVMCDGGRGGWLQVERGCGSMRIVDASCAHTGDNTGRVLRTWLVCACSCTIQLNSMLNKTLIHHWYLVQGHLQKFRTRRLQARQLQKGYEPAPIMHDIANKEGTPKRNK